MKVQNHVKLPIGGNWYRCNQVVFNGDIAEWKLSKNGRYDLVNSYEFAPHRQLISSEGDDSLRTFIKAWGPLRMFPMKTWEGNDPIVTYRQVRDSLRAWVRFLAAIEHPEHLRDSIRELLQVDGLNLGWVRSRLGLQGGYEAGFDSEIDQRIAIATQNEADDVASYLVSQYPHLLGSRSFVVDKERKARTVRAVSGIDSLIAALYWMVWQDYFTKRPWQSCEECGRPFRPTSHHKMKFCPDRPCAHRKAARESAQKKARERLSAPKLARRNKKKEAFNGT